LSNLIHQGTIEFWRDDWPFENGWSHSQFLKTER
jgi:hypothetical protein